MIRLMNKINRKEVINMIECLGCEDARKFVLSDIAKEDKIVKVQCFECGEVTVVETGWMFV